jgi:hypothetical protein
MFAVINYVQIAESLLGALHEAQGDGLTQLNI